MKLPYNPYDFANPVGSKNLFVGREAERKEVSYYLDELSSAPRPINLALLGPRAAGKTSFLNIIELYAQERGYCPVRIDLNEGDIRGEYDFFFKLFDSVLGAACERGAYGGTEGKTYNTYLDIAYALQVPEDRTFCPFLFPIQYAKTKASGGSADATVSDNSLKRDLVSLHNELNKPIILLFDECNVLAKSRILLEKIRNLFMNTAGFMLVLTGTPDLFPVIDDVFSPIVRQFKKVHIGAFKEISETLECVRRPLENIAGLDPYEVIDLHKSSDTIREIHELSGGRPYEVKLICHMLFRRVQQESATRMILDFSVLEDVRKELENSQDIFARPILARAQRLERRDFAALALLCSVDGRLSFEDTWSIQYTFHGEGFWKKEQLKWALDLLVSEGFVEEVASGDGKVRFRGDDFDKIYIKYLAKERRVTAPFWLSSLGDCVDSHLNVKIRRAIRARFETPAPERLDILGAAQNLADPASGDVFSEHRGIADMVYKWLVIWRHSDRLPTIKLDIQFGAATLQYWLNTTTKDSVEQDLVDTLDEYVQRSQGACKVSYELVSLPVPTSDVLVAKVECTKNVRAKQSLLEWHVNQLGICYLDDEIELATLHADLAARYANPEKDIKCRANVGYFAMAHGDLRNAEVFLAGPVDETDPPAALVLYNLAMLRLKQRRLLEATSILESCVKRLEGTPPNWCICLLVPALDGEDIIVQEERGELDLAEVANRALKVLQAANTSSPESAGHGPAPSA